MELRDVEELNSRRVAYELAPLLPEYFVGIHPVMCHEEPTTHTAVLVGEDDGDVFLFYRCRWKWRVRILDSAPFAPEVPPSVIADAVLRAPIYLVGNALHSPKRAARKLQKTVRRYG